MDRGCNAVAGDSAGANLGAALSLATRDRQGPRIAAQALIYGAFGLGQDAGSYLEFAEGLGLTLVSTRKFRQLYLPNNPDTDDPYARPLKARDFSDLPPALVHSAEMDPIRDDDRAYAAQLALAGNWVTYREARGMVHGFLRDASPERVPARKSRLPARSCASIWATERRRHILLFGALRCSTPRSAGHSTS